MSAVNGIGEGAKSNEDPATPTAVPTEPGAPQSLVATGGTDKVDLNWQAPANNGGRMITDYNVYRGTTSGSLVLHDSVGSATTSYEDTTNISSGTLYYYHVKAVNSVGEGSQSNEDSATPVSLPGAPEGFTASAGEELVELDWDVPISNGGTTITNYRIYRGESSGNLSPHAYTGAATPTDYTDTSNINAGTTYYYQVAAINSVGEGPKSTERSATPTAPITYSISGTVTTSNGSPLTDDDDPLEGVMVSTGSEQDTTVTSGTYTITGLDPGLYTITPTKSGFDFTKDTITTFDDYSINSASVNITDSNVTDVNFIGHPDSVGRDNWTFGGTITSGGNPVADGYTIQITNTENSKQITANPGVPSGEDENSGIYSGFVMDTVIIFEKGDVITITVTNPSSQAVPCTPNQFTVTNSMIEKDGLGNLDVSLTE